jgi:hypothetical protein
MVLLDVLVTMMAHEILGSLSDLLLHLLKLSLSSSSFDEVLVVSDNLRVIELK